MSVAHWNALARLASGVFVTLVVACGSSSGGGTGCPAECGSSGGSCLNGQCPVTLTLTIVSPAQATLTNSSTPVPVNVRVAGGSPAAVAIWVDELEIVKVGSPYEYSWDTSTTTEGVHALWARVTAGSRTYDSAPVQVIVDRTPPAAPLIAQERPTNIAVVPVQGTAEAGSLVTVYQGTAVVATAIATWGAWSTALTLAQDGTYTFTATATDAAGNVSAPSAPVDLVVDRTPPAVVTRSPAPDATNVWSRDPITVTFSEAILASTVTAQSVFLSSQLAALLVPFALSADGRTLTISAPHPLPEVPAQFTASLTGLTDLAGNALPTTVWSWRLPEWLEISTALPITGSDNSPDFKWAIASSGEGVVASEKGVIGCTRAIYRFHGSSWTNITAGLGRGDPVCARGQSIAVDDAGRIVLAYLNINLTDSVRQLYVDRWQDSGWVPLGPALN